MKLLPLLLVATIASASQGPAKATPEDLAVMLSKLRMEHVSAVRHAVMGGAEELRDAVASGSGHEKKKLVSRLPGMAREPFGVCRGSLADCAEAPQFLHVEDHALTDDAFLALARPWFKLQEARGKAVSLVVDRGAGVKLVLEDMPAWPVVTLTASPTPTGGFDVSVEDAPDAARVFAAQRAALLLN